MTNNKKQKAHRPSPKCAPLVFLGLLLLAMLAGPAWSQDDPQAVLEALKSQIQAVEEKGVHKALTEKREVHDLLKRLKVIYGFDDRKDYFEASPAQRLAADSTAVVVSTDSLTPDGDETFQLPDQIAEIKRSLCDDERFRKQPVPGFCSAFLVAPDRMATAGHCIEGSPGSSCADVSFVFGFGYLNSANQDPANEIPAANIYRCKAIVDGELGGSDRSDWRIVTLDRPVEGRAPLAVRPANQSTPFGADLTVIGHPFGLPTKIADNAKLRENGASAYFVANLDTYGGNSGSAVFNSQSIADGTPLVEGILVRGEQDFVYDSIQSCYRSKRCSDEGCQGEHVTRSSEFVAAITQ